MSPHRVVAAASISGLGSGQAQWLVMQNKGMSLMQDPAQVLTRALRDHVCSIQRLFSGNLARRVWQRVYTLCVEDIEGTQESKHTHFVCVCVCVCARARARACMCL
jgi:hypothetical protein